MPVPRSSIQLQARDRQIITTLARFVRVLSVAQIGAFWWPRAKDPARNAGLRMVALQRTGLVEVESFMAHPLLRLKKPKATWQPGLVKPDLAKAGKWLRARWSKADVSTPCVIATSEAGVHFAGHGGRSPRDSEVTHDIHLAAVYLNMIKELPTRAQSWVSEAALPKGQGIKVPDAIVQDGLYQTAVEFGGQYGNQKLEGFHEYCAKKNLGYEIW